MDFTFHNGTNTTDPWVEFYPYTPSRSAGYAFVALFGILTLIHSILIFPYRAAYFIPLIVSGICKAENLGTLNPIQHLTSYIDETFGYYGRAWSHNDRKSIGPWALQQIRLLCAPPFIAATIYMILGRLIRAFDAEHLSSIRTKRLTAIFVVNDVICFLTQSGYGK